MVSIYKAVLAAVVLIKGVFAADIIKISADGVRDPDPKYHPDMPRPLHRPDPHEEREHLDKPAEYYIKGAMESLYATCLARLCGHVVPAMCPEVWVHWWGQKQPLKCKCAFNGWKIDCPCDFETIHRQGSRYYGLQDDSDIVCSLYNHAELITDSRQSFKGPPHSYNDEDADNPFNPYHMTGDERARYLTNLSANGRCFPRVEPIYPLGVVDETVVKLAAIETCEQLRQQFGTGPDEMAIPPLLNYHERLFNNTDWITSAYWNTRFNKQYAIGVRVTADLDNNGHRNKSMAMDFVTCRERVYETAKCHLNPGNTSEPTGSGVSLFNDGGHILMIEVESRVLDGTETIWYPEKVRPLRPQPDYEEVQASTATAHVKETVWVTVSSKTAVKTGLPAITRTQTKFRYDFSRPAGSKVFRLTVTPTPIPNE
ncbi:uncharacterized protein N0V89_005006 [Didymosphaeria variabile]|uniref:Uncharacterized protein n=1 Tax=Didymosphaeria variabile TaxID=1932322 RepID=A0A9W8XKR1_9PLEO|nr:uncharacterized protein N0V89_005006 [Didymosphaeria variabile]KAJ4353279.1 hypothetical protein N0V89_005006 [Didymosphaeria variabile]